MKDVDYVLHVASRSARPPEDARALVATARDGTLPGAPRRHRRQRQARGHDLRRQRRQPLLVRHRGRHGRDTVDRPDDPALIPYRRSKTLAERAAWDFMAGHGSATTLTTILRVRSSARS